MARSPGNEGALLLFLRQLGALVAKRGELAWTGWPMKAQPADGEPEGDTGGDDGDPGAEEEPEEAWEPEGDGVPEGGGELEGDGESDGDGLWLLLGPVPGWNGPGDGVVVCDPCCGRVLPIESDDGLTRM